MRAISTKLATLSSTTRTVASFGMVGFRMGWVSSTLSGMGSPREETFNLSDQLVNIERLLDVAIASRFERFFLVSAHDVGRQGEDGDALKAGQGPDLCRQSVAIHVGHV